MFTIVLQDFKEMIIHHIATILLLYFSWVANFPRVGTLVLLVHDAADVPMAVSKVGTRKVLWRLDTCRFSTIFTREITLMTSCLLFCIPRPFEKGCIQKIRICTTSFLL